MYGKNSVSGHSKQYAQSLEKDVSRNRLSMAEYHSKKEKLLDSLLSGEESGETCTTGNRQKEDYKNPKNLKFPWLVKLIIGKNISDSHLVIPAESIQFM